MGPIGEHLDLPIVLLTREADESSPLYMYKFMLGGERERVRGERESEMEGGIDATTRRDRWGYPVRTASDACIAAIDAYYDQVLAYGRDRAVILRAARHDPSCVLANALAAHFLAGKDPAESSRLLGAASDSLVRLVFAELFCFLCSSRRCLPSVVSG